MDTVGDHYFPLLEGLSDELLNLEEPLSRTPLKRHLIQLLRIKRDLNDLKRAAWPMRDVASTLMQTEHPLLPVKLRPYLRDLYDNSIHVLDLTEGLRENVSSLQDLYYSSLNLRMNEIMKVLTIISAIFIPLSFVAGVYGMNFMEEDPYTGRALPNNMPELRWPYGYAFAWVIMGLIVVVQIGFFWRKGWLRNQ
jgi:magnesium transporter